MALTTYSPEFPYKGNQVIISSGRVLLHSKDDSIFLFGKKAVSLSSPGVFTVDAESGVTINAPVIELGLDSSRVGYKVIKGEDYNQQIERLLIQLKFLTQALGNLKSNPEDLAKSVVPVRSSARVLSDVIDSVLSKLEGTLSTKTYTL